MIFVTVGTQLPFDRLVGYLSSWSNPCGIKVFCQIGRGLPPDSCGIEWARFLSDVEFHRCASAAQLIVSHAGIGTLITASRYGKRVILVPRLTKLREHRNNHQVATALAFGDRNWVDVVNSRDDLEEKLNRYTDPVYQDLSDSHFDGASADFANALSELISPRQSKSKHDAYR